MTERLIIETGELHATADPRVLEGLLLPYGEVGRTNLGRFSVDAGVFEIPTDPDVITLNTDHARQQPVGRAVRTEERPDGLWAAFRFARTRAGDEALAEAKRADGRKRLSVEAADVVIRAGRAIAGRVYGAALVAAGAFPSATLLAADTPDQPGDGVEPSDTSASAVSGLHNPDLTEDEDPTERKDDDMSTPAEAPPQNTPAPAPAAPTPAAPEAATPTEPAGHLAAALPVSVPQFAAPATTEPRAQVEEPGDLYAMLAQAYRTNDRDLFAALSDVRISGSGTVGVQVNQPGWLGKLWQGLEYVRRFIPLVSNGPTLTALEVLGWKWTTKPAMGRWAGNKANVPSNAPAATRATFTAQRFAGGHDVGREWVDFANPEFWEEYFKAMRETYAQESDVYALETAVSQATAVTPGATPDGVSASVVAIVDAALAVNKKAAPTFAIVAEDIWRELLLTPHEKVLEYLSAALNLSEGSMAGFSLQPTPYRLAATGTEAYQGEAGTPVLTAGQVLVGARPAVEVRELGNPPIRVEGLDMVKGGVDTGLFGYCLTKVEEPLALGLVTPAAG